MDTTTLTTPTLVDKKGRLFTVYKSSEVLEPIVGFPESGEQVLAFNSRDVRVAIRVMANKDRNCS